TACALAVGDVQRPDVDAGPPRHLPSSHTRTLNPYPGTEITAQRFSEAEGPAGLPRYSAWCNCLPRGAWPRALVRAMVRWTVALPYDSAAKFADYAHPRMLVTTEWVAGHLEDPGLVVAESDEDVLLYETGHIPGAVKLDWHTELNDPVTRDYVDGAAFARLMSSQGITRDTTLVLYGDRNNWWAAYALWVCSLFGHPDLRLMDGGRAKWLAEGRPVTTEAPQRPLTDYPVVERDDTQIRAFPDQGLAPRGTPLIDVRSPGESTGEVLHMPDYPQEGALRGGHIPGAKSVPWSRAAAEDATFRPRAELEAIYQDEAGLRPDDDVVVYCRIGERSRPNWFLLPPLLGDPPVRESDRSRTRGGEQCPGPHHRRGEPVTATALHPRLQEIAGEFNAVPESERLQLLLEFAQGLPPLPDRYATQHDLLEPVPECQSPLFLAVEIDPDAAVHLFFDAPQEAPTTRGFAGILHAGLDGLSADEVLATPDEFTSQLGLQHLVSPLRLRGMAAMLGRIKRQIRERRS